MTSKRSGSVDPESLRDRTRHPEGVGGDDPLRRHDTFGDWVRTVEEDPTPPSGDVDDPKDVLRRVRAARRADGDGD